MGAQSKPKKASIAASTRNNINPPSTIEGYFLSLLEEIINSRYGSNVSAFCREFKFNRAKFQTHYSRIANFKRYDPLPRIVNTKNEGKLNAIIETVWSKQKTCFVKFKKFYQDVSRHYESHPPSTNAVKSVLRSYKIYCVASKNVANAENVNSCKNRLDRCKKIDAIFEELGIREGSRRIILFFDECCFNQLGLEDEQYLSPHGVDVYKLHHHTTHTESLSLLLLVDSNSKIIHSELFNNTLHGATNDQRVISFLANARRKLPSGVQYLYLDNAPCHKKAFNEKRTDNPATLLQKNWNPIWAPSCTPESNLAEFFFRSLKAYVRLKLLKSKHTMKGPEWLKFVQLCYNEWSSTNPTDPSKIDYIRAYNHRLILCGGNIQSEAIRRAGYDNKEALLDSIYF